MTSQYKWATRILAALAAVAGIYILLQSPVLAERAMSAVMRRHGGGMDTGTYLTMLEAFTGSYRTLGGVLLGVGLFRALDPGAAR